MLHKLETLLICKAAQTRNVADVSAGRGIDYMSDYMNPFTTGVVDTALGDIERQRARQQAAAGLQNAASSAFGSRGQIRQGMIDEAALDAGARTAAQLRESGFRTAAGLGMQDVNRLLAAGQTNQAAQLQRSLTDAKFQQDASQRNQSMAQQRALQQANLTQASRQRQAELAQARAIEQARLQQQSGLTEADLQMRGQLADQQSRQLADRAALEAQQLAGASTLTADELERSRLMDNLDLLSQIGSLEQDLEQRRLDEPFDALQFRAALLGMTPMPTNDNWSWSCSNKKFYRWITWRLINSRSWCCCWCCCWWLRLRKDKLNEYIQAKIFSWY
jgi:hypothetical protein